MKPIVTAIAGFGLSGRYFHAPFLIKNESFSLARIVRQANTLPDEYADKTQLSSFEEVLADSEVELVVISTPNQLHAEMAEAALMAGKHVVLEKPVAPDGATARAIMRCAEKQDRQLFVFHNRRLDSDFMTITKLLEAGMLGELVDYEAHFDRWAPELGYRQWKEVAEPSISGLHDLGTHLIDQAVALFGVPRSVNAQLARQRPGSKIYDCFTVCLDYGELSATLKSSMLTRQQGPHFILNGSKGSFVKYGMDPQEGDLRAGRPVDSEGWGEESNELQGRLVTRIGGLEFDGGVQSLPGDYMEFYRRVYGAIREDGRPLLSMEEALVTVDILDAALISHKEGRKVNL